RQLGSRTPGHPERAEAPGVEITTGPLGQGFANAVGFALAERVMAAQFNRDGHEVIDNLTWFIASDGDLMEGISYEAASLAGFLKLDRLIGIFDDNRVSLDGPTALSFGEDVAGRFEALGWRVLKVADGNDAGELDAAFEDAKASDGRPTMIMARTEIGFGSPNKQGSASSHGSPLGEEEVELTKRALGWPTQPTFLVPDEVAGWADECRARGDALEREWHTKFGEYHAAHPELAAELERRRDGLLPKDWEASLPRFSIDHPAMATRKAGHVAINAAADVLPEIIQGAADLSVSTNTTIADSGDITPGDFSGRNIRYGVREHAMGAITNALVAYGGLRPACSTFLTFSDYQKNTIRLAALMNLPSIFVFTHDSIAMGEDGPTHQPVEHLAALRAIPNVLTLRPADANETAAAWRVALQRTTGPSVLVLTRQGLPMLQPDAPVDRGAYVVADGGDATIVATGSEVQVGLAARETLASEGIAARVVSMPSWELFGAQDQEYREQVIPARVPRVAVEAASPLGWAKWVDGGPVVAVDRFGASAPGEVVMEALGITPAAVADAVRGSL
ncbi:MAG: transketolase, partial [Thermoleophilia bacterium]|nr:transketolase [Thermoleophilia bacterium]